MNLNKISLPWWASPIKEQFAGAGVEILLVQTLPEFRITTLEVGAQAGYYEDSLL
jgi:hypothetical protein